MKVAIVGSSHGALDTIYEAIARHERANSTKVDVLLCTGDFQVIGGKHEAMGYMQELEHGGWLAPNIYYLGAASCVLLDGWLRIAGSSGVFDPRDFMKGHYESVPFTGHMLSTSTHARQYEILRLWQLQQFGPRVNILMSHDWPQHIEQHGDKAALLAKNPTFAPQIQRGIFGSPALRAVVGHIKPQNHLAGHHHARFSATRVHSAVPGDSTRFLALGKPGGPAGEAFLEIIDVPTPPGRQQSESQPVLYFDPNWLAITRALDPYFPNHMWGNSMPTQQEAEVQVEEAKLWLKANVLGASGLRRVDAVQRFAKTAPATTDSSDLLIEGDYQPPQRYRAWVAPPAAAPPRPYNNPQATALYALIGLEDRK